MSTVQWKNLSNMKLEAGTKVSHPTIGEFTVASTEQGLNLIAIYDTTGKKHTFLHLNHITVL
ncbi:hypothetical protein KGP17_15405 [Serratia sp. JSRIV001]|uniref:hypothetical protein n=1 Tax=Serratia sp. JSRIV001 TaxID=2831893 RepID=UPI001CBD0178|nr:hypothetical protein [Serratia sp. JSRIV001]UAN43871.1 hypothetical protein KGP17_15405 [Serratia sp. JSRIV001]